MSLDPNPVFRKAIVPWYETKGVCYTLAAFMTVVLLFGVAGVSVAGSEPAYRGHIMLPVLLIILSIVVIISCISQIVSLADED